MAVFTTVNIDELNTWLLAYDMGPAQAINGIQKGVENSNFFVVMPPPEPQWVLTLFEKLSADQLPFYLGLMAHLAQKGLPVPAPKLDRRGHFFSFLNQRPAVLVEKLSGHSNMTPDAASCGQMGTCLARMHLAVKDYAGGLENPRDLAWCESMEAKVRTYLNPSQETLLRTELGAQREYAPALVPLPRGAVHLDLFRDNVMFVRGELSGVFDFYFAGVAPFVYDLAIAVNDWCLDPASYQLDPVRVRAFLHAYHVVRPLMEAEKRAWPIVLRGAALRFWLSRLYDFYQPRDATMLTPHDPAHFEKILRQHIAAGSASLMLEKV